MFTLNYVGFFNGIKFQFYIELLTLKKVVFFKSKTFILIIVFLSMDACMI